MSCHMASPLGLSPRVRGKESLDSVDGVGVGITPACAGKRPSHPHYQPTHWDHPRVCGEKRKEAAKSALDKFNADRSAEEKVCEEDIACVMAEIDGGDYTECADKDGNFCGDERVCQRVMSICAQKDIEFRAKNAEKKNNQFAWDGINAPKGDDGSVGALLRSLNIE